MNRQELIARYVAAFSKLDEMLANELLSPIAWQLALGAQDDHGYKRWQPVKVETERSELEILYQKLPARLPSLYEELILSYRWAEVDLQSYRLSANPPGATLKGLFEELSSDQGLWEFLISSGFIRFGKGPDVDYDPVCFDLRSRSRNGDYRIVKIDHEEILCNNRIKVVDELAPGFEHLVLSTIERAESFRTV